MGKREKERKGAKEKLEGEKRWNKGKREKRRRLGEK